jgi:hypothetical protein
MKHLKVVSRKQKVQPAVVQPLILAVLKNDKKNGSDAPPLTFTLPL